MRNCANCRVLISSLRVAFQILEFYDFRRHFISEFQRISVKTSQNLLRAFMNDASCCFDFEFAEKEKFYGFGSSKKFNVSQSISKQAVVVLGISTHCKTSCNQQKWVFRANICHLRLADRWTYKKGKIVKANAQWNSLAVRRTAEP